MAIEYACIVPHPPLIVPAVGKGEENKITATVEAYKQVAREIARIKPQTIVVASPHSIMYDDYIHISPGKSAQGNIWGAFASRLKHKPEPGSSLSKELGVLVCDIFAVPFMLIWAGFVSLIKIITPARASVNNGIR